MISKQSIDQIRETARVEEVVGDFVVLKRRGANMLGLCPFHDEKTPSFTVSPAKGIYKCFGCGASGDPVRFIMDHEHYTYPEALRFLAKKYKIELEETEATPEQLVEQSQKESLFAVTQFAENYFVNNLWNADRGKAIGLSYFHERGFTDETIRKFRLGYSFEDWEHFTKTALEGGYNLEFLKQAGLTSSGERAIDIYRGRVMFPIHNLTGRVLGFGGRILKSNEKAPKYINSPESDIYNKSKVLYGLFFAKTSIVKNDNCYLVEGYTDVISMHQAGIENVVSSSGTSLTTGQIQLIKRYTPNITILYDGDAAGMKASFRGIDMILEAGMNVKVVLFPEGEDPDSYSKSHSQEAMREFLAKNQKDFIRFKASVLLKDAGDDPIRKAGIVKEIVESIALVPDGIARTIFVQECSSLMNVGEQVLFNELNKIRRAKLKGTTSYTDDQGPVPEDRRLRDEPQAPVSYNAEQQERDIIRILLNYGNRKMIYRYLSDEGEKMEQELFAADFIVHELKDEIELENPLYSQVYAEIEALILEGKHEQIPGDFINHENEAVKTLSIDLLTSRYQLSEGWETEYRIYTDTEDKHLSETVTNTVYHLKFAKLKLLIDELKNKLRDTTQTDEISSTLMQIKQFEEIKNKLSKELTVTIVK